MEWRAFKQGIALLGKEIPKEIHQYARIIYFSSIR
jgi:hypothetical protein